MTRPLIEAGYRVGAIPPWLVLMGGDRWSCLQCGALTAPQDSMFALYTTATTHECPPIDAETP